MTPSPQNKIDPRWERAQGRILAAFWILALLLGTVQAWASRFDMSPDGIQYLDNGDAYFRGDFHAAANTQWSPLYSWLLGGALKLFHPSIYREFPLVHLVNFGLYLCAAAAFQYFLVALIRWMIPSGAGRPALAAIGCSSFLYAMLDFTNIANTTPDLSMAVFVFLAAGLLVRVLAGGRSVGTFLLLGFVLGLGYLAKAPFFVFSVLFLAAFALAAIAGKIRFADLLAAAAAFLFLALPYIAFLSKERGRITFGDSGHYNLIWMVNGVPYYHWQGGPAGNGQPLHPTRKLSSEPAVYEFSSPISGTYPPWYDPIYWNEGARFQFRIGDFVRALITNSRLYFWLFHHRQAPLILGLLIFFFLAPRGFLENAGAPFFALLAFAVFPFAMYVIVHADGRFLGAFFVLLWSALFALAIRAGREVSPRFIGVVCGVVSLLMVVEAALVTVPTPPLTGPQDRASIARSRAAQVDLASLLAQAGVKPGDRAAIVGDQFPYDWARLLRVRLVAQMLPSETEYSPEAEGKNAEEWRRACEVLARTPAQFVISPAIAGVVDQAGWIRLGSSGAFLYRLAR